MPAARLGRRSLKDALSEAGLGDAGSTDAESRQSRLADLVTASRTPVLSPSLAIFEDLAFDKGGGGDKRGAAAKYGAGEADIDEHDFDEPDETAQRAPSVSAPFQVSGVVSPAPWQRAAKRGRRRAVVRNTFGWVMTLVVAGGIIGLAGRYLAVPPHLQNMQAARQ
jgi:hypothetical protein